MSRIAVADRYYRSSESAPQRVHVDDAGAHRFSREVRSLLKALQDEPDSPAWDSLSRLANATRWRGLYDPVPFTSSTSTTAPLLRELMGTAEALRGGSPAHLLPLINALGAAAEAYESGGNEPFASTVMSTLEEMNTHSAYLIARNRRTALAIASWLRDWGDWVPPVLMPGEYARHEPFHLAIVCGPSFAFPAQLLTTPRAMAVRVVHHHWVRDEEKIPGLFGQFAAISLTTRVQEPVRPAVSWQPWSGTPAADLQVTPDWEAVLASAPRTAVTDTEKVPARLAVLSGNHAIWLPSDGERIRGLDPTAPLGERVISLPMSSVTQGTILILRAGVSEAATTRGVAYELFGKTKSAEVRRLQEDWKSRLRLLLDDQGPTAVARRLAGFGVKVHNIAHWAQEDLIQPRKVEDFKILLRMLGIGDATPYIEAGQMLRRAVVSAGHRLMDALESKANSCDLHQLEIGGVIELHLDDVPGAAPMTACQVLALREETTAVALHDCRRPFATRGVEWLE
ncbi:hypothetical protein ACFWYW_36335 [Nonomuraea sp. NPDC059023]|uniref:hypothetical protein n=1 Tax=unclassified Nonomuraea TaxID=2593643 RepID=UPI00369B1C2D